MQSISDLKCKLHKVELAEERLRVESLTEELKVRNAQIARLESLLAQKTDLVKDLLAENERMTSDEPHETTPEGDKKWYDDEGHLHRADDKPALIKANGERIYFKHGVVHRDNNKPARIGANGAKWWYINGGLGRTDAGPVRISADGKFSYQ
jgi:hypothetical protein